jgi:hypothetical protein
MAGGHRITAFGPACLQTLWRALLGWDWAMLIIIVGAAVGSGLGDDAV